MNYLSDFQMNIGEKSLNIIYDSPMFFRMSERMFAEKMHYYTKDNELYITIFTIVGENVFDVRYNSRIRRITGENIFLVTNIV